MWQKIQNKLAQKGVQIGLASTASLLSGAAVGFAVATQRAEKKWEKILDEEIEKAKVHYSLKHKVGEFADPVKLAESVGAEVVEEETVEYTEGDAKAALQALRNYKGEAREDDDPDPETDKEAEELIEEEIRQSKTNSIFENAPEEFDWDEEMAKREASDTEPFVITSEEFLEGTAEYETQSLTYFEGDSVLADEKDQMVDVDSIVNSDNLRFGYGSKDPNIVYVRNPRIELDMEIVRSEGSYAQEVLGFVEEDEMRHSGGRIRKFRESWD